MERQDKTISAVTTFHLYWHEGRHAYAIDWNCANIGQIIGFYGTIEDAERAFALLTPIG